MALYDNSQLFQVSYWTDFASRKISIQRLNEEHVVAENTFFLNDIPDYYYKVFIVGKIEIDITATITTTAQFKVDYNSGQCYFHSSLSGSTITISKYYGKGRIKLFAFNIKLLDTSNLYSSDNVEDFAKEITQRVDNLVLSSGVSPIEVQDAHSSAFTGVTSSNLKARLENDAITLSNRMGALSDLQTTIRTDLVSAINETHYNSNMHCNVMSYGAKGDGTTDDTTAIQLAINTASSLNVPVFFPSGTFIIIKLTIPSGLKMYGNGQTLSIIKRKANTVTGQFSMLKAQSASNIEFDSIGFNGNKANVTNNAHNVLFSSCSNILITNCRFYDSYRSGLFIEYSTNVVNKTRNLIQGCMFDNNSEIGMYVNGETQSLITQNKFFSNTGSGFSTLGTGNINIDFVNNESAFNGDHGVVFSGHNNNDSTQNDCSVCTVSGNNVHNNVTWGITFQCSGGIVTNNTIKSNGSTTNHAGLLLNGYDNSVTNNYIDSNYYYGIDMGDWINGIFTGNTVVNNGNVTTGGIGLNAESCVNIGIVGNFFWNNGNASGGYQLSIHGIGGGSPTTPFRGLNNKISVNNNTVTAGNSSQYGIYVDTYSLETLVVGNQIIGFVDAVHALQYSCITNPKCTSNMNTFFINPVIASASSITIPDDGNFIFVSGTTTLTEILTTSSAIFKQKVSRIDLTNFGTGYTSPPTVSITGGGGSGATAQAYVELSTGLLTSIAVTNGGSGYTSAPTIGITGGGGSSAAAAANVGCNSYAGREIKIKFQGSITINNSGNIGLVGGTFAATSKSTLVLIGEYGSWTEVSRSTIA